MHNQSRNSQLPIAQFHITVNVNNIMLSNFKGSDREKLKGVWAYGEKKALLIAT